MRGVIRWFRNAGVYLLFVLVFWLVYLLAGVAIYVLNHGFDGIRTGIAAPFATVLGGIIGVNVGVGMLDRYFEPYPARTFAVVFIVFTALYFALSTYGRWVVEGSLDFKDFTAGLGLGAASITSWIMLWKRGVEAARLARAAAST
ncbi:MAG TPA: hypothetical protein VGG29_00665 [Caulobacteraceae bacterium]|jgi:hypothetical protein